jgi:paraquat-inducible protein B
MSDDPPPAAALRSETDRRRRISLIWAIPIVTLLVAGWLAWDTLSRRGPEITISFQNAEGLQAGQSHVKHKDVDMGLVENIALSSDLSHVVVTVRMNRAADPLLTDLAQFWVVKPRLFAGSISGLSTLFSGSYIELLPSGKGGEPRRSFEGLEDPPVLQSDTPGHTFLLKAQRIGSITVGSPIFYRDLPAGEVLGWEIGDMAEDVTIHAFVRAPFDQYVHNTSRFWNASGVSVKLGAEGVSLQLESLRALLLGGIAFETPRDSPSSPVSAENHPFTLYADQEAATAASYHHHLSMKAYFTGSLSGLAAGSPVEMQGIKIGQVTSVNLVYDPKADTVLAPVTFDVEPERVTQQVYDPAGGPEGAVRRLVKSGMRAQLQTANFITGQKVVALDIVKDTPPADITVENGDVFVIPAIGGGFSDITRTAGDVLAKVDRIPFDQIGASLNETLKGTAEIANGPQLKHVLTDLSSTLANVQDVVKRLDAAAAPTLKRLPEIAAGLQETVTKANKLIGSADTGYGDNSKFKRDLDRLMGQLNDAARSIRLLSDLLQRHPEALIRGRTDTGAE